MPETRRLTILLCVKWKRKQNNIGHNYVWRYGCRYADTPTQLINDIAKNYIWKKKNLNIIR